MKSKKNIKSIVLFAILGIVALFFINMSFAANNAKINVETANLRETPDAEGKILEQLSLNDEVELVEKSGEWYKVKSNGITGYIRQDLLTVKEEVTDNNTTNNPVSENTVTTNTVVENVEATTSVDNTENVQEEKNKLVSEDTKLKIVPAINATNIIEVKANQEVTIIETINNWVCIQAGNTKGWIRSEKLKVKAEQKVEEKQEETETEQEEKNEAEVTVQETKIKTQFIASETVNLRKEPNTSSEIVSKLSLNMAVDVYSEEGGWSKVKVSGKEGYISSSLLSDKKKETSRAAETPRTNESTSTQTNEATTTTSSAPASQNGGSVVETAKSYIGSSYVYGASGPSSFDCSGFTSYIYKQYGVSLNRTAAGQYSNGTAVSKDELQPGDLVMFGKSGINHVGIYIGGGQMVHAANPSRGVTTDTINSGYYYNNYVGARRVN